MKYENAVDLDGGSSTTSHDGSALYRGPPMKAVELYAGAGGMSLGLRRAGFDAYGHMQCAVDVYNRNIGYHAVLADLGDIASIAPEISKLRPDLIVGDRRARISPRQVPGSRVSVPIIPKYSQSMSVRPPPNGS